MLEKYNQVFAEIFNIDQSQLSDEFEKDSIDNWDSDLQLALVEGMEDKFDIMLDTEDILNFTSYMKGKEILAKYEIELSA